MPHSQITEMMNPKPLPVWTLEPPSMTGRRRVEEGGQVLIVRHHLAADLVEHLGVVLGEACDAGVGLLLQVWRVDDQRRTAICEGDAGLGLRLDHAGAAAGGVEVLVEGHIVDELHVLGMEVVPEAGDGGLFGMHAASLLVPALEHADLQARPGPVGGRAETVVAPSDYHRIVASVRHGSTSVRSTKGRGRSGARWRSRPRSE